MPGKFDSYQEGGKDKDGDNIYSVIAKDDKFVVYFTTETMLAVDGDADGDNMPTPWELEVAKEYDRVMGRMKRTVPRSQIHDVLRDLGCCWFTAVHSDGVDATTRDFFGALSAQLDQRAREYSRVAYIVGSSLVAIPFAVVAALAVIYRVPAYDFCFAIGGGVLGAIISVMRRSDRLKVDRYAHRYFICFQGATRSVLGIIFGLLLIACIKGGFVFHLADGNHWALLILGAVAGHSETFIPEIMSGIESSRGAPPVQTEV